MAAHLSAPFIMTWDDREVDNDYAGDRDEHDTPPEVFLLRRAAAYQAYYESMPLRASTLPSGATLPLYRRLQFGNLIDFNVLDTRQYRSKQAACGDPDTCPDLIDVRRTILGTIQEGWLFENLSRPSAQWTVLGRQLPTSPGTWRAQTPPHGSRSTNGMATWMRGDDCSAIFRRRRSRIRSSCPATSTRTGAPTSRATLPIPRQPPSASSSTNSSITSGGDGSEVQPTWDSIRRDNPHITYHGNRRGYVSCTATPNTMRADFRVIDRVSEAGAPVRTAATRVVEAGRPGSVPS